MKKRFLLGLLVWLCILAVLILFDVAVMANIRVTSEKGGEIAPYRILTPPIFLAESVPEDGTYEELERLLGPPTDWVLHHGDTCRVLCYDLQWGGVAICSFDRTEGTYRFFSVLHTRLGTGRWLILPGIMLAVAVAEVALYKLWKKKKRKATVNKADEPTTEPQPQPADPLE